jgi:hypothetical protein
MCKRVPRSQFPADSGPTVQMLADEVEKYTGYKFDLFANSLAMLGNGGQMPLCHRHRPI